MQQVAKGYTATFDKLRTQIKKFPPICRLLYGAVSGVWNAFEIKLYDILIDFNSLKLLKVG